MEMTDAQKREFEEWLEGRPEKVRETATKYPPHTCYTQEGRGHYRILSYGENGTVKLAHGTDSYRPGVAVFGVQPDTLVVCGCGKWRPPTEEQIARTRAEIEKMIERRRN